jgi:hypothetical protein
MVTDSTPVVREVINSGGWITPSPSLLADGSGLRKPARLLAPIGPHAINNVGRDEASKFMKEVESDDDEEGLDGIASGLNENYNLLIPQLSFQKFISENFCCKHCHGEFRGDRSKLVDKIGFASNVLWACPNKDCASSASILAPACQIEASGKFRRKHPTAPAALSDYAINRQVLLACQQSGGGARMASTFGGLLSISKQSIWMVCFTIVEELLGKFQIWLGKNIIAENLKNEITLSPMNDELKKAKLTLMMDGGWDQRASGKAYNSASGRHVSVGARTNKVVALVYYSKWCSKCEKENRIQ